VVELTPKSGQAWFERGAVHEAMGNTDAAIDDFTEALWFEPKALLVYVARGTCYLRKEKLDEAVADFEAALRINPQLVSPTSGAAWRRLEGNRDQALRTLTPNPVRHQAPGPSIAVGFTSR
jgi:tetratricopeptide (TPR) repeat protein